VAREKGGSAVLPLLVVLALILALPATVSAQGGGRDRPTAGGSYRRPLGHDPQTLDPATINDVYSRSVSQQIFDGLVQFDRNLTITPALAEFWKASRDGLTWTFTLRKGVKFHHGRELGGDDVVYSLTRLVDPKTKSGAADLFMNIVGAKEYREGRAKHVAGLVVLDRHSVQVRLTDMQIPFVSLLAVGHAKIVPRDVVERDGESFGSHPIGTGPFRFVRWDRGKEIVLAGNPQYFEGAPLLNGVVYRIYSGEKWESTYEDFQRGVLEDASPPTRNYRDVVSRGQHIYIKRPMSSVRFYGFNTTLKPLDDRRVRQAIIYALNRELLIDEIFQGRYATARGILPPGTMGFNPNLRSYAHDVNKARALLVAAGYPGGRGLPPLAIWSSVKLEAVVRELEQIKTSLQRVGIPVELHYQTDWPTFSRMLDDRKAAVFLYAWHADVPDPDNFLFKLFHSRSPRNFFGYANPAVDALLARARKEHEIGRRVEHYRRAEQMIMDDAPLIPMMHHTYERLFQPYVRSIEVNGLGDPYIQLRKIWLERPR
jgi:peptide/nickel transport system substrate-binding protein/oligopeptide transport system substrate-binding protein